MMNKCPRCGFVFNKGDLFCAKCGYKFYNNESDILDKIIRDDNSNSDTIFKNNERNYKSSFSLSKFNNTVLTVLIFFLIAIVVLVLSLYTILGKYENHKEILDFKNLISNPSQIPILKEPKNYSDLSLNLREVDNFLYLYLKYMNNTDEQKTRMFEMYLKELDKLPNILNYSFSETKTNICRGQKTIKSCRKIIQNEFKNVPVQVYNDFSNFYLYPDYNKIKYKYSKFIPSELKKYVDFRLKYKKPVNFGLSPYMPPFELQNKIFDCENLFNMAHSDFVKDETEKILYDDIKKFIFTPSIYQTTTQEMKKEYQNAYLYFISRRKTSNLRPLLMSYMDKKRTYSEDNFISDYPYTIIKSYNFEDNINQYIFLDIFSDLRRNLFSNESNNLPIKYVYNPISSVWRKYRKEDKLYKGEYLVSEPNENNNISIYNNNFSLIQDINILKYSDLYLINNTLYAYNKNRLAIFKIKFNGKIFSLYNLNKSEITSLFPGIEVINLDTLLNYDVVVEKVNKKVNYILISPYSQSWHDYRIQTNSKAVNKLILPNMFSVDSIDDIFIVFKNSNQASSEFKEKTPEYKLTIHTIGQPYSPKTTYTKYDKQTHLEENKTKSDFKPTIMPKLLETDKDEIIKNDIIPVPAPTQVIEPPNEKDED